MKKQQLNANSGISSELQVTQNKQLAMPWVGRSAKQKKILKMKDDPTMCMKTQGHATKCQSQFCDFGRVFATGLQSLSARSQFIVPGTQAIVPETPSFHLR